MRSFEHALNGRAIAEYNAYNLAQEQRDAEEARRRQALLHELMQENPTLLGSEVTVEFPSEG